MVLIYVEFCLLNIPAELNDSKADNRSQFSVTKAAVETTHHLFERLCKLSAHPIHLPLSLHSNTFFNYKICLDVALYIDYVSLSIKMRLRRNGGRHVHQSTKSGLFSVLIFLLFLNNKYI